jgi:hypothetical protein
VLEFREVPAGNLEKLKAASLNKKKAAVEHTAGRSPFVEPMGQAG